MDLTGQPIGSVFSPHHVGLEDLTQVRLGGRCLLSRLPGQI